jgi:hypothetical protein
VKLRRLREGDVLDDGGVVRARGGALDPEVLRGDALRYHGVYGSYGISLFAVRGLTFEEMAQQVPLVRFDHLTLIRVASVIGAGLRLEPTRNLEHRGDAMDLEIDLIADLNAEDDEGLGWSDLSDAVDPSRILPGVMMVAGNRFGRAVVRVVAVDQDGQVHFTVLPGSVEKNRHLIGRALA